MSELPPHVPIDTSINYQDASMVNRDHEHIKILAIFWYIVSGLAALGGFFPIIYIILGAAFMTGKMPGGSSSDPSGDKIAAIMFILMGGCACLFIWSGSLLAFLTARSLNRRRRFVLCVITAASACLSIPFGTLLGVFTFVILFRPSVKASFT